VAEVRARMAIMQGKPDEAVTRIRDAAASATTDRPRVVRQAAQFLESIGRRGDAIELLSAIPADQQDPEMLLQLGDLLLASREPSPDDPATAKVDVAAQLDQVQSRLRELEGDEGTRWRWLAAMRTLQAASGAKPAEMREAVTKASILQTEITSRRPRWSRGLTLGGRIAAAQGNARQAVDLLRRGIAEGDKEPTTVVLLASQLNRLGDAAAAEQELGRLSNLTDSVGQISALAVGLALGQGKFDNALERARAGVKSRPNDHEALLILAQTATAAARAGDQEQVESLRAEAGDALRRAIELTKGRDLGVWQTQFRIQIESGGGDAARQTLEAMGKSELPEKVRFLAVAGGFLALRDFDQTSVWLDMAKAANPTDENVALTRAALARATNDNDAMLAAYQEAYRLAPQREDIRRTLALALAAPTRF